MRLAIVATAIAAMMTPSETQVLISGIHSMCCPPLMNGSSFSCSGVEDQLHADEGEDERDPVVQVHELLDEVAEQEVELPQAA